MKFDWDGMRKKGERREKGETTRDLRERAS